MWKQTLWEIAIPLLISLLIYGSVIGGGSIVIFLMMHLLITGSYSGSINFLLNQIVTDKEVKMRETLRILGSSRWAYALSYFLSESLFAGFTSLVLVVAIFMAS